MDETEKEEILYRLDERTERVDENLDRLDDKVRKNEQEIHRIDNDTKRNSQHLHTAGRVIGFLSASVAALIAKVLGVLGL
jgi:hypothetical protein